VSIHVTNVRVTTAGTGSIEFRAGLPTATQPLTRLIAALLWVASIETYGEAFAGERPLPGDPDGLADAQSTLWMLAVASGKEF
jgi:hypothetical protein